MRELNRRGFFRGLLGLAMLPFLPKVVEAKSAALAQSISPVPSAKAAVNWSANGEYGGMIFDNDVIVNGQFVPAGTSVNVPSMITEEITPPMPDVVGDRVRAIWYRDYVHPAKEWPGEIG